MGTGSVSGKTCQERDPPKEAKTSGLIELGPPNTTNL